MSVGLCRSLAGNRRSNPAGGIVDLSHLSVVPFHVEVSAKGRFLVLRSPVKSVCVCVRVCVCVCGCVCVGV